MPVRRHGVDHRERDAITDQPVGGEISLWRIGLHRMFDEIETLVEPIRAVKHVMIAGAGRRQHGVAGLDDVATAHFKRVDAEPFGQFVDRSLYSEQGLWQAVAAEGARRHRVGVGDDGVDLLVCAIIDAETFTAGVKQHRGGMIAIGAGVREHVEL